MENSQLKAATKGERFYFTNRKCKRDHKSKRLTASGACVKCLAVYQHERRLKIKKMLEVK